MEKYDNTPERFDEIMDSQFEEVPTSIDLESFLQSVRSRCIS